MLKRILRKNALAFVALFFAVGGTAGATGHYLITSTAQIKPSVRRALHSRGEEGLQGPQGPQGPVGPGGPAGPSNLSALTEAVGSKNAVLPGEVEDSIALCAPGQHVVSGGGFAIVGAGALNDSQMSEDHQAWFVITHNEGVTSGTIQAYAYCAGAGQAVAATNRAPRARTVREVEKLVAQIRLRIDE